LTIFDTLKRSELFLGLENKDIEKIVGLPSCRIVAYTDGATIFKEGEEASEFFILEEGKVSLIIGIRADESGGEQQTEWRTITRGGIFGWTALIPPHIRIGAAVSRGASKVVCINGRELRMLFDNDTQVGYEVMKSLVRVIGSRVWNIEKLLATGKRSPFI